MSIVGEIVLTVTMEMLFKKMASEVLPLFGGQEKIRSDLEDWQRKLKKIKAVLDDAEEKQMTNESVKIWLCNLQNLAYDVEDILDEFATEALKRQLLNLPDQPSTSKFRKVIPICCINFSPSSIKFDYKMIGKIDEITDRLQRIAMEKNQLELNEISGGRSKKVEQRLTTTSLVKEAKIYGREKEKKEIIELLLRDDLINDDGFSVIPIVGLGGMGKTTLAQLVYNDKIVQAYFDFKIWVCVSEDFDIIKVANTILRSIDDKAGDDNDLNRLQEQMKNKLLEKKLLLVLDDVWNENGEKWELLSRPFGAGSPKSKIVVTTRSKDVASIVGNVDAVPPYELNKLSDDDCFSIFTQQSLGTRDFNTHQHLKEIGENIVKKCDGLPLAAKTLGSLLRRKRSRDDWLKIQNSKIWELSEEQCGIMKALRVSYHYLPAHLKSCFAHCSLLPKDYEFHEQEVVLLWMAEGLLQPDIKEKKMEECGRDYFEELQSRSFFQQSSIDKSKFVMHDLINDLAQWAAGEIHFRMEEDWLKDDRQPKDSKDLRHLSYTSGEYDGTKWLDTISTAKRLRTFIPMKSRLYGYCFLSYDVVDELFERQYLRFLSLRGYYLSKIPTIEKLLHLRYLDLSKTQIVTLPESVSTLYNLHTLLLEDCNRLKTLCTDMGNLLKLRHLNNSNTNSLEKMPLGIGKLTCLQTLHYFVVGKNVGSQLQELNSLENLCGKLKISGLENIKDVGFSTRVELNGKKNLHELFLEWSNNSGRSQEPEVETHVLDMLRPHENLKQLTIKGYSGTRFPTWFGDFTFSKFVHLSFEACDMCTCLPTVGQLPILKHLSIVGMAGVKSLGPEFYGGSGSVPFPSLQTLLFENLKEWEDWIPPNREVEAFPQLQELSLVNCSKLLGRLPKRFPLLERLVIKECEQLLVSIPSIPTLCKLEINGCRKVVWEITMDPSSSMVSSGMSEQVFQTRLLKHELPNLKDLTIQNTKEATSLWQTGSGLLQDISSLHQLKISSYPQFFSLLAEEEEMQEEPGVQCKLQNLELNVCQSLLKLPAQALLSLVSLKMIEISNCDSLESLPESWMHSSNISLESLCISCCNSLTCITTVRLPLSLKQMVIQRCKNLRTLIDEDQEGSSIKLEEDVSSRCSGYSSVLELLVIEDCPSLISLSKSELPATLESIKVSSCSKLACLSSGGNLPNALKDLRIGNCSELESIAEGLDNNTSLEKFIIVNCQNLRLLPNNLFKARHLQSFALCDCPKLVFFPEGGLQACTKLTGLSIYRCEKLKILPNGMRNLTSLQDLLIFNCPSIELCLPEDEAIFSSNISYLGICYMKIYKPLYERRLHRFTSITTIDLDGGCSDHLVSFPPEENTKVALPTSVRRLWIKNFRNLERLDSIFENLTALELLGLWDCPKLEYFPENRLPPSLLEFVIINCPLLSPKFVEGKGQYWPLIARVPRVYLD